MMLRASDFDYHLPQELIAQIPVEPRDTSRLLVVRREDGSLAHRRFYELPSLLNAGDVLVFNNSRVIRARLYGRRLDSGKPIEILLLRRIAPGTWETLIRSRQRVRGGLRLEIESQTDLKAEVETLKEDGLRVVHFSDERRLPQLGHVPLPPYIHAALADPERYQTVYASQEGSVAAPTAGLHFTPELLDEIRARGVHCVFVTLHVGLNTFRPLRTEEVLRNPVYPEYGVVTAAASSEISRAKSEKRRVVCVGTTAVRLVEWAAQATAASGSEKIVDEFEGWVNLFITPGYQFRVMDALITNFHLPKSTLLMLVSAFAGKDLVFRAYREAIREHYRFYSFGDAMFIV
jgi:S-adenosylmethionine:tRNA ribosyltransferase-isomerase